MIDDYLKNHAVYKYAQSVVDKSTVANWEVTKVCTDFLSMLEDDSSPYFFDINLLKKIDGLFQYINFGSGSKQGRPISEGIAPFQIYFIANILCWKHKDNPEKRKNETGVLLIGRKNGKTFLTALIFILLLLTEPKFSTMFSVSADLQLSSILKEQMETIVKMSPAIAKYFKFTKKEVTCAITESTFTPLATSQDRLDGRICVCYLVDEVGALKDQYPISAMQSSQVGDMTNKTGILISTAYPSENNPMQSQIDFCESILHGEAKDESLFCLLYKPDKPREWQDNDDELLKANPLAQISDGVKDAIFKKRQEAIIMPATRSNFLCKHMNIFASETDGDVFVTEDEIQDAELTDTFDWTGRRVYLGIDLSMSNDNTAVAMSTYDKDRDVFVSKVWAFYPKGKEAEKTRLEHVPYAEYNSEGIAYACGNKTISYEFIEKFIKNIPQKYGVSVDKCGYDRWNSISTVNKLDDYGFDMYEIKQNASGLYSGTKLLRERMENNEFFFEKNDLLKTNFRNAMMIYDMNLSYYLNKKKSNGKIDMCAALVNTMCLWADEIDNESNKITGDSVFAL